MSNCVSVAPKISAISAEAICANSGWKAQILLTPSCADGSLQQFSALTTICGVCLLIRAAVKKPDLAIQFGCAPEGHNDWIKEGGV